MQLNGFPVRKMKLSELVKAPWNPRKISPEQSAALQRSLKEFGTVEPIVWNKQTGHIVGGHQRVDALLACGEQDTDVVIVDMPEEREQALNIALNRISGDWDNGLLSDVLLSMHDDLRELTGFSQDEILSLLPKQEGLTDPDAIPEVVEPVAKLGDIWQLGDHRLMCGDSTDAGSVALLMGGWLSSIVITSPPYFNQREYSQWDTYEKYLEFARMVVSCFPICESAVVGINIGSDEPGHKWMPSDWWQILQDSSLIYQESIAWVKSAAVWSVPRSMHIENCRYFPAQRWEIILVAKRGKHPTFDVKDVDRVREFQDNVWEIPVVSGNVQKSTGHPAMFPVEIPNRFITAYSMSGDSVFEPFLGSGSTLIACEQLNRKCYGMELDPHYCDVIINRWEDFTGKQAVKIA